MSPLQLAQKIDPLEEFLSDPILTVACVMLIVVSIGWVLISRLIVRNLRKAALRGRRSRRIDAVRSERDIWSIPP